MPGLVPGIPILVALSRPLNRDGRDKPGHDVERLVRKSWSPNAAYSSPATIRTSRSAPSPSALSAFL